MAVLLRGHGHGCRGQFPEFASEWVRELTGDRACSNRQAGSRGSNRSGPKYSGTTPSSSAGPSGPEGGMQGPGEATPGGNRQTKGWVCGGTRRFARLAERRRAGDIGCLRSSPRLCVALGHEEGSDTPAPPCRPSEWLQIAGSGRPFPECACTRRRVSSVHTVPPLGMRRETESRVL